MPSDRPPALLLPVILGGLLAILLLAPNEWIATGAPFVYSAIVCTIFVVWDRRRSR